MLTNPPLNYNEQKKNIKKDRDVNMSQLYEDLQN